MIISTSFDKKKTNWSIDEFWYLQITTVNYFVVMTDQMTVDIMDEIEGKKVLFTDCRLYSNYLRNGQWTKHNYVWNKRRYVSQYSTWITRWINMYGEWTLQLLCFTNTGVTLCLKYNSVSKGYVFFGDKVHYATWAIFIYLL